MSRMSVAGTVLLSVPAIEPAERSERHIDQELVDLLCDDAAWLDEAFRDIVAANWAEPPRGGAGRLFARPRRFRAAPGRVGRRVRGRRTLWSGRPHRRQRSPP